MRGIDKKIEDQCHYNDKRTLTNTLQVVCYCSIYLIYDNKRIKNRRRLSACSKGFVPNSALLVINCLVRQ